MSLSFAYCLSLHFLRLVPALDRVDLGLVLCRALILLMLSLVYNAGMVDTWNMLHAILSGT